MNTELTELLERAVRARRIIVTSHLKHKERVKIINDERKKLLLQMTTCAEQSIQFQNLEREIDVLDQQEYELHKSLKKILNLADKEIDNEITGIMERHFGPTWNNPPDAGNVSDYVEDAT